MFDPDHAHEPVDGVSTGAAPRETQAVVRLSRPSRLLARLHGVGGTRAARCRLLRRLPALCRASHRRQAVLFALMQALGDRDPEVRIAAMDGLHALALAAPRLRERVVVLLTLAASAPSRSTAMHAATLAASIARPGP